MAALGEFTRPWPPAAPCPVSDRCGESPTGPSRLHFSRFGHLKGIIELDAEVSHGGSNRADVDRTAGRSPKEPPEKPSVGRCLNSSRESRSCTRAHVIFTAAKLIS